MNDEERGRLRAIGVALEAASIAMARVVADSGAPVKHKAFVQRQWLRLAEIQVAFEDRIERASDTKSADQGGK